jgi:hypothetical protein
MFITILSQIQLSNGRNDDVFGDKARGGKVPMKKDHAQMTITYHV